MVRGILLVGSDWFTDLSALVLARFELPIIRLFKANADSASLPRQLFYHIQKLWPDLHEELQTRLVQAGSYFAAADSNLQLLGQEKSSISFIPYQTISSFLDRSHCIDLRVKVADHHIHLQGQYLIGMDGAASEIRQLLQVETRNFNKLETATKKRPKPYVVPYLAFGNVLLAGSAAHQFYHDIDLELWLDDLAAIEEWLAQKLSGRGLSNHEFESSRLARQQQYMRTIFASRSDKSPPHPLDI